MCKCKRTTVRKKHKLRRKRTTHKKRRRLKGGNLLHTALLAGALGYGTYAAGKSYKRKMVKLEAENRTKQAKEMAAAISAHNTAIKKSPYI